MYLIHSTLAWGFLLVAAPIVIHLLNLLRQRRIEWAAMQFLLVSHRKQRHWIRLRQFLLLLCRTVAIALAVAMLARVVTHERWANWFQAEQTHYYLLLDDSFSMGERAGAATALDRGIAALNNLVEGSTRQQRRDKYSLVRFSEAEAAALPSTASASAGLGNPATEKNAQQDLATGSDKSTTAVVMRDLGNPAIWQETWKSLHTSETACGPLAALRLVTQLIKSTQNETSVVVVVSDFRTVPWDNSSEVQQAIRELSQVGASVELLRCVDRHRPNLTVRAIRQITPQAAAGVPVILSIEVQNHGPEAVSQVPLRVATRPLSMQSPGPSSTNSLPDQIIDNIPAGETVPVRIQVFLNAPGDYVIEARVPEDALDLDNRFWQVLTVVDSLPVLVIAEEEAEQDAFFLQSVFQPDAATSTGFRTEVQPVSFLRQVTAIELQKYVSMYVVDCPILDRASYEKIASYVREGGGCALFAGPRSDTEFWNAARPAAAKDEVALLDFTARRIDTLPPRISSELPDISPTHPMFQVLQGDRNPWLPSLQVERYLQIELPVLEESDTAPRWEIAASLRNQSPLAVTRRWGNGQVVAFLSTLGPRWNNWARQPSYVVFLLSLQEYLTRAQAAAAEHFVGANWKVQFSSANYRRSFGLSVPGADPFQDSQAVAGSFDEDSARQTLFLQLPDAGRAVPSPTTPLRGPYRLDVVRTNGATESLGYAVNVDPAEGDLHLLSSRELADKFSDLRVLIRDAGETQSRAVTSDRAQWSQWLLLPLVCLLIVEQILAYFTSYHPSAKVA
ncbi:MAG: BatA domain-containing protein [Planctomycetota bacterium]|nr:BatA domain-containing protein [Planctomycetota bacterium]